jgi:hypothetical protein
MAITIESKKAAFFEVVLKDALKHVLPKGSRVASFSEIAGLEGYVLTGFANETQAFRLLYCFNGLPPSIRGEVLEYLVLKALIDCNIKDRPDKEGFVASLQSFIDAELRQRPTKYQCMFFLQSTNLPTWILQSPILGFSLRPAPKSAWKSVSAHLARICSMASVDESSLAKMRAVEITVSAKQISEVIDSADQVSCVLRGAYELSQGLSWQYAMRSTRNTIKPSPLYIVRTSRDHCAYAYVPGTEVKPVGLLDQCPRRTSDVLKELSKVPDRNSPSEVLTQALHLYAASGDELKPHNEFLSLWQALEALSLVEGGDTLRIARNIGNLWTNGNETVHHDLLALAPLRNKLVHSGH